jgi:hypothetical protein
MAPSSKVWLPEYAIFGIRGHLIFPYLNSIDLRACLRIQIARHSGLFSGKKLAELTWHEQQPQLKGMFCHPK